MKGITIVWVVMLFVTLGSNASEMSKAEIVAQVTEKSGLVELLENLPEQILQGAAQGGAGGELPSVSDALLNEFDMEEALNSVREEITNTYETDALVEILEWLNSPLGESIVIAESKSSDPEFEAEATSYFESFLSSPPDEAYISLIGELEEAGNFTEGTVRVVESILNLVVAAGAEVTPNSSEERLEQLQVEVSRSIANMEVQLYEQVLAIAMFTYREFEYSEIEGYIGFLNSSAGQQYTEMSFDATETVINRLLASALPAIVELAAQRNNEPAYQQLGERLPTPNNE